MRCFCTYSSVAIFIISTKIWPTRPSVIFSPRSSASKILFAIRSMEGSVRITVPTAINVFMESPQALNARRNCFCLSVIIFYYSKAFLIIFDGVATWFSVIQHISWSRFLGLSMSSIKQIMFSPTSITFNRRIKCFCADVNFILFSRLGRYKGRASPRGGSVAVGEEPQDGDAGGLFGKFRLTVGEDDKAVR